ncbi:MAG TPA: glycosyltransferase family 2 protein [Verrucomicrobiota bacterium]|nr:MAG: hypothetical protein BWX84_02819 [Verrucomicrobia bacterium ADurb.Bin118]HPY29730.1 glycosyltransferase family 2 protein [Verrucomicrobiota bacterium]HQB15509.1 glycosyltransferase family 2 protein [Verrucomicrobiota bacterium]
MSASGYDVAVAYRVYPHPSANPPRVYAEDKFKLVELCLRSFKASLGGLRVRLWVLLNDCPPRYEKLFRQVWPAADLVFRYYPGVPPGTTLHEQSQILLGQTDAELVYWAEDDYFYLPGQFAQAVDFLRQHPDADFVSPYDHPDYYTTDLHRFRSRQRTVAGRVWSSRLSNTHTILARHRALQAAQRVFLTFHGRVNFDLAMWMALTKRCVFNPVKLLRWSVANRFWAGSILLAWYYFWRQILFGRRYQLWVPRPALATHMITTLESPGVDWPEAIRQFEVQLAAASSEAD